MTAPVPSSRRQLATGRARPARYTGFDGRPLTGLVAAPGDPARAVAVMVPGYTGSKEDFAPLLDPLAAAGVEAVALDLPGQYGAPGPETVADYAPHALAADLVLVAGALRSERPDAPVHLVGHSYGGLVARAAVLAAPAAFDSLVLLDSGPAAVGGGRRALVDAMEPVLAAGGPAAVYAATLALGRRQPDWEEPPADLAALGLRVLVVCGADDDAWPVDVQRDMAARLDARLAVVPDARHSPAVENPAALLAVLREFWAV